MWMSTQASGSTRCIVASQALLDTLCWAHMLNVCTHIRSWQGSIIVMARNTGKLWCTSSPTSRKPRYGIISLCQNTVGYAFMHSVTQIGMALTNVCRLLLGLFFLEIAQYLGAPECKGLCLTQQGRVSSSPWVCVVKRLCTCRCSSQAPTSQPAPSRSSATTDVDMRKKVQPKVPQLNTTQLLSQYGQIAR